MESKVIVPPHGAMVATQGARGRRHVRRFSHITQDPGDILLYLVEPPLKDHIWRSISIKPNTRSRKPALTQILGQRAMRHNQLRCGIEWVPAPQDVAFRGRFNDPSLIDGTVLDAVYGPN
jgi:hypothetical protein